MQGKGTAVAAGPYGTIPLHEVSTPPYLQCMPQHSNTPADYTTLIHQTQDWHAPHPALHTQRARHGQPNAVKQLTWAKRLDMLRDVAAGMSYLHTRRPAVVHGDLRSPNLLLDMQIGDKEALRYYVKIADFGLAK